MKGRDPNDVSQEDDRWMISIRRKSTEAFCSREPGTVRDNLKMLRKMETMYREELGLEYWFHLLGPYPPKYEVGMGVACVNLSMSLKKGIYVGHLLWEITRKGPKEQANIYGYGVLGMRYIIYTRDGEKFTETACSTSGLWFGKFMKGSKL